MLSTIFQQRWVDDSRKRKRISVFAKQLGQNIRQNCDWKANRLSMRFWGVSQPLTKKTGLKV